MSIRTAAEALVRVMVEHGIDTVFGTVGHGNLPLVDAIAGEPRLRYISAYHEQVAIHAADAYYRTSGRVAAVVTTVGPGATNLTTGLGDALLDCSAVVVITGGVPSAYVRRDPLQALSVAVDNAQWEIFRPLTKRVHPVGSARDVVPEFRRAYAEAINGRPGPVLLHVPLDFFSEGIEDEGGAGPSPRYVPYPDPTAIARAAALIRAAECPLIYAGGGAQQQNAPEAVSALASRYGIPVATSMSGQGVINEDHPLSLGTTGVVGTRTGNTAIREADVVIAIGTRFPEMDASSWRPDFFAQFPPARLIHIDIDPDVINRGVFPAEVGIVADAAAAAGALAEELADSPPSFPAWRERVAELKSAWEQELAVVRATDQLPFEPAYLLTRLRAALPDDAVLVSGVGIRHAVAQHFAIRRPRTLVVGSGFGTMGQEPAAAIGAAQALPGRAVVAPIGDGALLACLAAIPTAVTAGTNLTWLLLDNGGYASIAVYQAKHYGRLLGTDFVTSGAKPYAVDYTQLARSFGAWTDRVTSAEDLEPKLKAAIAYDGPAMLVVPVTPRPRIQGTGHWDVNDIFAAGAAIRAGSGDG